ncbi:hypothetical protein [Chromobacterium amazonense]|uniref:hypothetical protein n=1 Tax=Chromobacterium amazonense TaxID=1382803 RepID=UPI0011B2849F|nr:hypothetical protein [Chromobacterium amazonense]
MYGKEAQAGIRRLISGVEALFVSETASLIMDGFLSGRPFRSLKQQDYMREKVIVHTRMDCFLSSKATRFLHHFHMEKNEIAFLSLPRHYPN